MTVTKMTLSELQAIVDSSCDFFRLDFTKPESWLEMIKDKAADSGFGYLVESVLDNGFDKRCPIVVKNGRIWNGHHRLVAAILTCSEVYVSESIAHGDNDVYDINAHSHNHWGSRPDKSIPYSINV